MRAIRPLIVCFAFFIAGDAARAALSAECADMKSWQLRLALAGSNLANVNTTRTPDGGPYKPFELKWCKAGQCDASRGRKPIIKHLPDHPDASGSGDVSFPNLDQKSELLVFTISAKKLKTLATAKVCGAQSRSVDDSTFIQYTDPNSDVREDIFSFDQSPGRRDQLTMWSRVDQTGRMTSLIFDADGNVERSR